MTQHLSQQQNAEDRATLLRLGKITGGFLVATAIMALTVGLIMT